MTRSTSGFSMIELLVVVAIAGVLASVAAPAFLRYVRKSKTSEATINVRRMYESGRTYILEQANARGAVGALPPQFPDSQAITPSTSCCESPNGYKCLPRSEDWQSQTWQSLRFAMEGPHYFRYEFVSTGSAKPGPGSRFTARALGDLDCDGNASTFEMAGEWSDRTRDVQGSAGFFRKDELE